MAYRLGDIIAAADLNGLLQQARLIYGLGEGDRGYGQTAIQQPNVNVGDIILSDHWARLRAMADVTALHQGTGAALLPVPSLLAVGEIIEAHEDDPPTSDPYDFPEILSAVDGNRLTAAPESMAVTDPHTIVRTGTWGGSPRSIQAIYDLIWPSEDAARHFFNSGGGVRVALSHPFGGTAKDARWCEGLVNRIGTIELRARSTVRSGASDPRGSLNGGVGYYTLGDAATPLLNGENIIVGVGGGSYGYGYNYDAGSDPSRVNDVWISAQRLAYVGERGGNGSGVRLTIALRDEIGGAPSLPDALLAGTMASIGFRRAVTPLAGIVEPSFTVVASFSDAGI